MSVEFKNSETKKNLMKAFAGESMARNRYTLAAEEARKQKCHVLDAVFTFTANQEKENAEIFFDHLRSYSVENVDIDAGYPVDTTKVLLDLLKNAVHNEYEEFDPIYKEFAAKAKEEGFDRISASFTLISEIEKTHGDRFKMLAELLEQNKLFVSDIECKWMCLNCGYVYEGKGAPEKCPVCEHDKGFFIRLTLAPYTD